MTMDKECPRKIFPGCRFEARYDYTPIGVPAHVGEATGLDAIELLRDLCVKKIYVGDVCVKCGRMVKRPV